MAEAHLDAYVISASAPGEAEADFQISDLGGLFSCGFFLEEGVNPSAAAACGLLELVCEQANSLRALERVENLLSIMHPESLPARLLAAAWAKHPMGAAQEAAFAALEREVEAFAPAAAAMGLSDAAHVAAPDDEEAQDEAA